MRSCANTGRYLQGSAAHVFRDISRDRRELCRRQPASAERDGNRRREYGADR
jgi:hypothetical protein